MRKFAVILLTVGLPALLEASPIKSAIKGAELRGAATFRLLGLPLYDARLFTKSGAPLDWGKDLALELKYQRNLSEFDLVEGTMRELKRTGGGLPVRAQLEACFQDIKKGDRYLAISNGQNELKFWLNNKPVCTLAYPRIKARFMGIFLGENTRSKSFTRKLRGE